MDPAYLAIMLLILGLALIVAEFFIPSSGMITVMAITSLVASVWFAWKAWGTSHTPIFWTFVSILILSLPATLGGTLYAIQNTRLGSSVLLQEPSLDEVTPYSQEQHRLQQLVGKVGRSLTMLNPGGMVLVDGERIHSETPGLMIEADTDVEVIAVKGTRIVVRPAPAGRRDAWLAERDQGRDETDRPLDFDIPPS